jgi:hypothetical protein
MSRFIHLWGNFPQLHLFIIIATEHCTVVDTALQGVTRGVQFMLKDMPPSSPQGAVSKFNWGKILKRGRKKGE